MKKPSKKVLIISYNFPPMGGGGVFRVLKFCKYLPNFNWLPIIMTVKEHDAEFFDDTLLNEIPKARIHNTYSIDLPLIYKKYMKKNMEKGSDILAKHIDKSRNFFNVIKKFIDNFILIPDSRIGWIPFAVHRGYKICKNDGTGVIFTTGSPWTNHLIGLLLKMITRLPWVADFRDPWTQNPYFDYPLKLKKSIEKSMEKSVLSRADSIVTTTKTIADSLKEEYPGINQKKFFTITNGFDSDDFSDIKAENVSGFNITYTGDFYSKRTPKYFLQALKELLDENKISEADFKVKLVGKVEGEDKELIRYFGLDRIVQCIGYVSHKDSIRHMINSDVLLLISTKDENIIHSKLYDYMASKNPILALSGEGEITDILNGTGIATLASPDNVKEIKNAIYNLYLRKQTDRLDVSPDLTFINKFDRKELTRQLANLFDRCLNS